MLKPPMPTLTIKIRRESQCFS